MSKKANYQLFQSHISDLKDTLEAQIEEIDQSIENTPENLQTGERFEAMETRQSDLNDQLNALEEIVDYDWDNP